MGPSLRAVVVTYGRSNRLAAAVDSIEAAGRPLGVEIVIVGREGDPALDGWSGRASVEAAGSAVPITPGAHRNLGARGATAPWILFADGDVMVEPAFVSAAVALLEGDPKVSGVGGRIHERQWRDGKLVREVPDLHRSGHGGEVEMLAAAWIARRAAFEAVGGFDPRLPAEEDMELCVRLASAGGRLVALDARAAYHDCTPRPSLAEIRRRFQVGLFAGQGLLLRHSWGTPFFARHLRRQRLFLATLAYFTLGIALGIGSLFAAGWRVPLAWWAVGAIAVWALMSARKGGLSQGGLAILTWLALGLGIVRAWITGSGGAR